MQQKLTLTPAPLTYEAWKNILADIPMPAGVVDLDAFDRNVALFVRSLKEAGGQQTIRLATKSVRVPALIGRVLDSDPVFQGLMTYCAAEADFLASEGFDDLLIAYPTVQPADLQIIRRLHDQGKIIRLMIDSVEQARIINAAMAGITRPCELHSISTCPFGCYVARFIWEFAEARSARRPTPWPSFARWRSYQTFGFDRPWATKRKWPAWEISTPSKKEWPPSRALFAGRRGKGSLRFARNSPRR